MHPKWYSLLISLGAALLFLPFLGAVPLFDWDEINFAESAREMLASGEFTYVQINYQPFWEKPPLFIWMQAFAMQVFGVNEFAARFPNAICGIATLWILFVIGKRECNRRFGLIWVMAYAGSLLPHLYFKSGIIDPWFNLFIFLGIYFGYRYLMDESQPWWYIVFTGVFTGASMLTKGPVGPLIVGLVAIGFLLRKRALFARIRVGHVLGLIASFALVGGFWFLLQVAVGRGDVLMDFMVYQIRLFQTQDAGHGGFFGYHFVILLIGVFPASIWGIRELYRGETEGSASFAALKLLMQLTFWVVLILFSIVRTKIVHYSSMCYFPLTFLAAIQLYKLWEGKERFAGWQWGLLGGIGLMLGGAIGALMFGADIQETLRAATWLKDPFAKANLQAEVGWKGYEGIPGILLICGLIFAFVMRRKRPLAITSLFAVSSIFIFLTLWWVVPRIERISQHASVEFFSAHSQEDAYVVAANYKSYTPFFYGKVRPDQPDEAADKGWLLLGPIDKPVYVSTRLNRRAEVENTYLDLTFLYEKNGFVFYRREPPFINRTTPPIAP